MTEREMVEYPYVSIIIPNYNDAETLSTCVKAARESDYPLFEVIVVDDASTDISRDLLRRFRDVRVVAHEKRRGQGAARNSGAKVAKGEVLLFTDGDVCIARDTVTKAAGVLEARPDVAAVVGLPDRRGVFRNMASIHFNRRIHYNYLHLPDTINVLYGTICAVRRGAFETVGGFSEKITGVEDNEIGMRMTAAGMRIAHCKQMEVTHFKRISIGGLLLNDFRRTVDRVRLLAGRRMLGTVVRERRFITSPLWQLVSPLFAAATVGLSGGAVFWPPLLGGAAAALALFIALNGGYLRFVARDEGWCFSIRLGALLLLDMTVVGVALVWGGVRVLRGEAYR